MFDVKIAALLAVSSKALDCVMNAVPNVVPEWFREWGSTGLLFAAIIALLKDRSLLIKELASSRKEYVRLLRRLAKQAGLPDSAGDDDEE